jgi:hypothetical protein
MVKGNHLEEDRKVIYFVEFELQRQEEKKTHTTIFVYTFKK